MKALNVADLSEVRYETPAPRIARIVMDKPEKRNAQSIVMTYELDAAFREACHDDAVSVIILAGAGDHFSSGHDLSGKDPVRPNADDAIGLWGQFSGAGWEGDYSREKEVYLDITERWRNAPKPTIAEVQGICMTGGNMLVWACDLIVASDDARFKDSTADLSMPGAEFFAHPWELGIRKAKEWLFTSDWLSAQDAACHGMINHVVPRADLADFTLDLALRIADKDRFTLKLIKESVNAAQDAAGRRQAMNTAFALHQLAHVQNMLLHGFPIDMSRLPSGLRDALEAYRARTARDQGAAPPA